MKFILPVGERSLRRIVVLSCNIVRSLADTHGILLLEEIPVYWRLQFDNEVTIDRALRQTESLVLRDRNRAVLIMWLIGNENPDSDGRLELMRMLAERVRALDRTRLITTSCLVDVFRFTVTDGRVDFVDVVSLNQYYRWYTETYV
jgi:beta-glucuronidase